MIQLKIKSGPVYIELAAKKRRYIFSFYGANLNRVNNIRFKEKVNLSIPGALAVDRDRRGRVGLS